MKKYIITSLLLAASAASWGKLPALSDEAKAKAAETAAKTAWTGKQDAYLLCKSQDRVAAHVKKTKGGPKDAKPAAKDVKDAKAVASAGPAAPAAPAPCADPGPFVYTAPEAAKPLEVSGAHSPAATAKSPPSTNTPAAAATPAAPAKKI